MPHTSDVTIMFTDVVGSTQLLDRLGDELGAALMQRHFAGLRSSAARHGGCEVKNLGDGLMITFADPAAAVACAASMQRGVVRHNLGNRELALALRIGIHRGLVLHDGDDYFGKHVVIAKRLCDSCEGGEVIVSDAVRSSLTDATAPCTYRGALALRGISDPVDAADLHWNVTSEDDTPAAARDTVRIRRFPLLRTRTRTTTGASRLGSLAPSLAGLPA
ncbi:MAG TPA: adenylate/guanylate cyclase domain-containing protein [Jatrophihabitantaceae bacterium]|nr:adenylate/guanylate cyclase domain-containing protein [Jatrophihabitantaceae bacterium]